MKRILLMIISFMFLVAGTYTLLILIRGNIEVNLIGSDNLTTTVKEEYVDQKFKIMRNGSELSSDKYTYTTTSNVDTNILGTYQVQYDINYLWRHYKLVRQVNVIDDILPEIKVNVTKVEKDYCTKKTKTKLEYSAEDNYDGVISEKINLSETENEVILSVMDNAGNEQILKLPINYTSKPNPVYKLNGNSAIYVALNTTYKDSGAIYQDGCGKTLSTNIKVSGSVDTSKVGTYTITYTNPEGKELKRSVTVYNPTVEKNISTKEKIIYLTFDDGPGSYTEKVLNTLSKYNVKATFFVTHQFGSYVPLIKKEHEQGHAVGVHSYTHNWNVYKSVDAYIKDFNKMNDDILKYTGSRSRIFRFPGGSSNTISRNYARGVVKAIASRMTSDGYVYFDWDVDSGDAAGASRSKIYNNVVNGVKKCSKCVVLMHDIKPNTVNELDNILKTLTSKGYKFGTLSVNSPTMHHSIAN